MFCYCRLEWSVKVSYANWLITLFKFSIIADFMSIVCMKVKVPQSCPTLSDPMVYTVHGVDSHPLLQGIFPTQGLNPGLRHCRQILYQLSHKGSPRILEWVAYPFSSGSSRPRNQPGSSALRVDSLPTELSGKPVKSIKNKKIEYFILLSFIPS